MLRSYEPFARALAQMINETTLSEAVCAHVSHDLDGQELQQTAIDAVGTVVQQLHASEYRTFKDVLLKRAKELLADELTRTIHGMVEKVPF